MGSETVEPLMENPFRYLVKERQFHSKRAYLQQNETRLAKDCLRSTGEEKLLEKRGFDGMVLEVLTQLQGAVYPNLSLRNDAQGWAIGKWYKNPDGSIRWNSVLVVRLVYDELTGKALCFECVRSPRSQRAELSGRGLVEALGCLYPKEKAKRRSDDGSAANLPYDDLVVQAFGDLKNSFADELHLLSDAHKWIIGYWRLQNEALEWASVVEIRLIYGWKKRVKAFECLSGNRSCRADLNVISLSAVLFDLYGEIEAPG